MSATFGPAGNSDSFYKEKHKSTLEAPKWLREKGLDAYEYSAGNGITGSTATFEAIGKKAKENGNTATTAPCLLQCLYRNC